ncbi:MAG: gephyrin-like molybdotransferase Glp [Nannocystaceae bacterium]
MVIRNSNFVSVARAQALVLAQTEPGEARGIPTGAAAGLVLAEAGVARWSLPNAPVSVMDGYAIRASDVQPGTHTLRVVDESAAGHPMSDVLGTREAARISTGAVLPSGADAVVPQEETTRSGNELLVDQTAAQRTGPGRFVRPTGSDVRRGDPLLPSGTRLGPGELALLAGCGHAVCKVVPRPQVALLCTGDELVNIGTTPGPGQVVNTNRIMLAAQVREAGGDPLLLESPGDDPNALREAMENALKCDLLITSGGISVGDHDHVRACLDALDFAPHFSKVRLRPGKPTTFGVAQGVACLALPGNPASSLVAFELFARPWIRKRLGLAAKHWHRPIRRVSLTQSVNGNRERAHYVRAHVRDDLATPLDDQSSGALRSIAGHNALVHIPEGIVQVNAGDAFDALLLDIAP